MRSLVSWFSAADILLMVEAHRTRKQAAQAACRSRMFVSKGEALTPAFEYFCQAEYFLLLRSFGPRGAQKFIERLRVCEIRRIVERDAIVVCLARKIGSDR